MATVTLETPPTAFALPPHLLLMHFPLPGTQTSPPVSMSAKRPKSSPSSTSPSPARTHKCIKSDELKGVIRRLFTSHTPVDIIACDADENSFTQREQARIPRQTHRHAKLSSHSLCAPYLDSLTVGGTISGNGSGLTNVRASNVASGTTLRGNYGVEVNAAGAGARGISTFSFGLALASAPTVNFIAAGGASTTNCPGSSSNPLALAGQLCVYESFNNGNVGFSCIVRTGANYACGVADPSGAGLYPHLDRRGTDDQRRFVGRDGSLIPSDRALFRDCPRPKNPPGAARGSSSVVAEPRCCII